MGACCSSKLSEVHSPEKNDRPGKDSTRDNESKKEAINSIPAPTTTTVDDVRTADAEVVPVSAGVEPPGTLPGAVSPRTEPTVTQEVDKPAPPKADTKPQQPESIPVVPTEPAVAKAVPEKPAAPNASTAVAPPSEVPPPARDCKTPSIEDHKLEPASSPLAEEVKGIATLQPVSVLESEVKDIFDKYLVRVHADFQKTFDCSWKRIEQEIEKCSLLGLTLEWFWIAAGTVANPVEEADGLVVIKVHKGSASKRGEVVHMSIAGDDWRAKLPQYVDVLKQEMFRHLAIQQIHMTLWYSEQKDTGKFSIDPAIEPIFKERGFRWFQLTNTSDGKRGQIMSLKRVADDGEMPQEVWDLAVSLCTFMPVGDSQKTDEDDLSVRPGGVGSRVIIAECLRRHAAESWKIEQNSENQEGPANQVEDVFTSISKRAKPGVREVCTKDAKNIEEAEEFFKECQCDASLPSRTVSEVKTWLKKKEGVERFILGGATVVVDWIDRGIQMDPQLDWATQLRVPVRMLAKSPKAEHPLSYLGTSDDEIFIVLWPCKKDDAQSRQEFLKECVETIRSVEQIEDPLPFTEVLLPRFELKSFEDSVDIHRPAWKSLNCDSIQRPKELVSVELTAGHTHRGALKKNKVAAAQETEPFFVPVTSEGSFVFCIWHAKLDDLEEPLFLARVDPSDWCKELS
eukprot:gnl/MRDRNA2_/MRDRNA2_61424_c0_seq1.p1 gnl/MRDRNA2_/MRDRNA2_61424_c0~~gnl/MRDRNA2_/MRDRNA2_61424_c0_seq1.p1  ORF type:complete len:700 (-),score=145.75 gnl/MRDRNA2_/MRDRNA2_61424_c0_seq1:63-2108(-)